MDTRAAARLLHDFELRLAFAVGEAERRRGIAGTPDRAAGRGRRGAQRRRHGSREAQR